MAVRGGSCLFRSQFLTALTSSPPAPPPACPARPPRTPAPSARPVRPHARLTLQYCTEQLNRPYYSASGAAVPRIRSLFTYPCPVLPFPALISFLLPDIHPRSPNNHCQTTRHLVTHAHFFPFHYLQPRRALFPPPPARPQRFYNSVCRRLARPRPPTLRDRERWEEGVRAVNQGHRFFGLSLSSSQQRSSFFNTMSSRSVCAPRASDENMPHRRQQDNRCPQTLYGRSKDRRP